VRVERHSRAIAAIRDYVEPQLPESARFATAVPVRAPAGWRCADLIVRSHLGRDFAVGGDLTSAGEARAPYTVIYVSDGPTACVRSLSRLTPYGSLCVWHVCMRPPAGYRGPAPVIIARWRAGNAWRERFEFRGRSGRLPLCVGPGDGETAELITISLDPGDLTPTQWLGLMPGTGR
jgi:hypothetical protein